MRHAIKWRQVEWKYQIDCKQKGAMFRQEGKSFRYSKNAALSLTGTNASALIASHVRAHFVLCGNELSERDRRGFARRPSLMEWRTRTIAKWMDMDTHPFPTESLDPHPLLAHSMGRVSLGWNFVLFLFWSEPLLTAIITRNHNRHIGT